jgi:hypothetical protein
MITEKDLEELKFTYLGYENGWNKDPNIVVKCRDLKHRIIHKSLARKFDNIAYCPDCRYYYKYDSS